ncbi:enoyl-CoA isomerase [Danaus plexippus plexippus]|uniref:Enoyl-CoA isomerase n=1 Tax=Danaus plexippus plexippus TaxID=278856 RepID=A0A212FP31_DANPL|nr:enoyl-CoA isomerase [Danaus plexippus plexippus]
MAMSCEYRVMTKGNFTIGMNETSLGLVAPSWFMELIKNTINQREAEYAFTTSRMFTPEEALKVLYLLLL